jgi:FAD synthase
MRDIIRYPNPEALQDQISLDVQKARQLLLHFRLQDARVVLK